MHIIEKQYYAKVLLVGEYSVVLNGPALTMPFRKYSGSFSKAANTPSMESRQSQLELHDLGNYIRQCIHDGVLPDKFNYPKFVKDIDNGMIFHSDIPLSYGLGSSGALTAAVYENYFDDVMVPGSNTLKSEWELIRQHLSTIESHFHGKSSGLDPVSCLVNRPLHLNSDEELTIVEIPDIGSGLKFFLIDTKIVAKTAPLVKYFTERMEEQEFQRMFFKDLIPATECLIRNILAVDSSSLLDCFRILSAIQLQFFCPMIPNGFEKIWEEGLDKELFYLKLCGSGGGGYLLGITSNYNETRKLFENRKLDLFPLELSER
jgi:mevalonate kinase